MPEWVLPPRRDTDRTLPKADVAGTWRSFDSYTPLHGLAADLSANADVRTGQDLVSVPDAWGHIDTFRVALSDEDHALHASAVQEWRALLALFALDHRYMGDAPLETREVLLRNGAGHRGDWSFGAVLSQLLPPDRLADDMDWGTPVLIFLGGYPVGMLSPSTLVAPARDGLHRVRTQRPWLRDGAWRDPTDAKGIVEADLACLSAYLETLRGRIRAASGSSLQAVILRELNQYMTAVSAALSARGANGLATQCTPRPLSLNTGTAPLFRALRNAFEFPKERVPRSELILPPRPGLPEGFKGGVLMDANVAVALERDADSIICWDGETLARVTGDPAFFARQAQRVAAAGYLPLTLDDLFTPTLALFEDAAQCTGHPAGLEGGLVPLTPLALLFMDAAGLRQALRVPPGYTDTVVELTVRLQDAQGRAETLCPLRRAYSADKVRRKLSPLVFLWPNFSADAWSHYYTYSSFDPNLRYGAKKPLDQASVTDALEQRLQTAAGLDRAFVESLILRRLPGAGDNGPYSAIARTTAPPEALVCGGGDAGDEIAGLLLLPSRRRPSEHDRRAIIGVDFGTTNTCVYSLSQADGMPRPLTLKADRVWWPYRSAIDSDRKTLELPYQFLPVHATEMPFRTLLYRTGRPRQPEPIRDIRIVFPVDVLKTITSLTREGESNFYLDIKWADQDQNLAMNMFMSQIVVLAMAEMVDDGFNLGRVEVRFSYPEAFTSSQAGAFEQALRAAMRRVEMDAAFRSVLCPESVAASYYFRRTRNIVTNQPFITLDVGGHTSDAAIWLSDQLLWKGSLEIGGRDLLIRFLAHHRDFFAELLDDGGVSNLLREDHSADQVLNGPLFSNVIETIVNSPGFTRALDERGPAMDARPEMVTLRSLTILAFAGMLHYLGSVARLLKQDNLIHPKANTVTLCFGGRGSLLFRKFCETYTDTLTALSSQFLTAGDLDPSVRVVFEYSDSSKGEVAAGLTQVPADRDRDQPAFPDVPLGEEIIINAVCPQASEANITQLRAEGFSAEETTSNAEETLGSETGIKQLIESQEVCPRTELKAFRAFLNRTARAHRIQLTNVNDALDDIASRVEMALEERLREVQARLRIDDKAYHATDDNAAAPLDPLLIDLMHVQPPFIAALRLFAHALAEGKVGGRTQ